MDMMTYIQEIVEQRGGKISVTPSGNIRVTLNGRSHILPEENMANFLRACPQAAAERMLGFRKAY